MSGELCGASSRPKKIRTAWLAGTRGEILTLGGAFDSLCRPPRMSRTGWLLATGEQAMPAAQALDALGLVPDQTGELCHPADESALRLKLMLERAEAFVRRTKATHVIFSGAGPLAAATALVCHACGCPGLWVRRADPAQVLAGLDWEAGLLRVTEACAPVVQTWDAPGGAADALNISEEDLAAVRLADEVPGLRPEAPRVVISLSRREWGAFGGVFGPLAQALGRWAAASPQVDWVVASTLDARLEGPLESLGSRPSNLLSVQPLPRAPWLRLTGQGCRLILTDSYLTAAQALATGLPLATLTDRVTGAMSGQRETILRLTPADLLTAPLQEQVLATALASQTEPNTAALLGQAAAYNAQLQDAIEQWLQGQMLS